MPRIMVDSAKCVACHSCELRCAAAHSLSKTLFGAVAETPVPLTRVYVEKRAGGGFPLQCRHCEEPQCVKACATHALSRKGTGQDSPVVYDRALCIGCSMCVIACPFGCMDDRIGKCDLCEQTGEQACVAACPTKAIFFQDTEEYNKNKRRAYVQSMEPEAGTESETDNKLYGGVR